MTSQQKQKKSMNDLENKLIEIFFNVDDLIMYSSTNYEHTGCQMVPESGSSREV